AAVDVLVVMTGEPHQLAHDLRIGLPVEAVILRARGAEHFDQRAVNRAAARAVGEQDRAVDVKQNELHVRVSTRPPRMPAAPTPCQMVGTSPSSAHATS